MNKPSKKLISCNFLFIVFAIFFAFTLSLQNGKESKAADTTSPYLYFSDFQGQYSYYEDAYFTRIFIDGGGMVLTFVDETGLKYYNSSAYYRYQWCYDDGPGSYQGCQNPVSGYEDWTSVTASGGSRTSTRIDGTLFWPLSGEGNLYLWIEGDITDTSGNRFYTECKDVYCNEDRQYYPYIFNVVCDYSQPTISIGRTSSFQVSSSATTSYYADNTSSYIYANISDAIGGIAYSYVYIRKGGSSSYTRYSYSSGSYLYATNSYFASGANYVYFYAVDKGGWTRTSSTYLFYLDETTPTLGTSGSSTTWTTSSRTITLTGSDAHSGISAYLCNGSWKSSTASSYSCTFSSSTKTSTVGVKDKVGKQITTTINVYVDKTAPTVSVNKSYNATTKSYYAKAGSSITVSVKDNHSGIDPNLRTGWGWTQTENSLTANSWNTSNMSVSSTEVTFTATVPNSSAGTVWYLGFYETLFDNAGNAMSGYFHGESKYGYPTWIKITIDNEAPTLIIGDIQDGHIKYDNENTVHYTPGGGMILDFEDDVYLNNYSSSAYYRYQWCYDATTNVDECSNPISGFEGWTSIQNGRTSKVVSSVIDVPTITTTKTVYLWIEGDISDAAGNVFSTNNTDMYCDEEHIFGQPYIFKVVFDFTQPIISTGRTASFQSLADTVTATYYPGDSNSYMYAYAIDEHSGVSKMSIHIKNGNSSTYTRYDYTPNTNVYTSDSRFTSGANYVYFTAEDNCRNWHQDEGTFVIYLDKTAPTLSYSGDSTTWSTTTRTITIKGTDAHSGVAAYLCNGTWVKSNASSYSCKFINSTITSTIGVRDNMGRETTKTINVYLDIHSPIITTTRTGSGVLIHPETSTSYIKASSDYYVYARAEDAYSGVKSMSVHIKNGNSSSYTKYDYIAYDKIYANDSRFTSGANYIYFSSIDNANNEDPDESTFVIYIDKSAPTININATELDPNNIDLSKRTITIPLSSLSDAHSGIKSIVITNELVQGQNGTCNIQNKTCTFNFDAIKYESLKFKYYATDNAGNTSSEKSALINTVISPDVISTKLKSAFKSALSSSDKTLSKINSGKQLRYTINGDALVVLEDLIRLGIIPSSETIDLKYIFVNGVYNASKDYSVYDDIAKTTTLDNLKTAISSPLGLKNEYATLVLFIFNEAFPVGSEQVGAASATALSNCFDTYTSTETTYQGAGLGEDGTVVSFSSDATSSMAVTLGASNMIEKRDVYGNLEWEKAITSSGKIELKKVINNEYGILVLGETTSGSINGTSYPLKGGKDILVIRLDKQGNILFTNVIGTKDNDLVIAGDMNDNRIAIISSINENQASLITMNVDGTGLNINTISSTALELTSVAIKANKVVVTGTTKSESIYTDGGEIIVGNVGEKDAFVLLFTNNNLTWARRLGGVGDDTFYSVSLDNNNIYIVGQSNSALLHDNLGSTKMLDVYGNKDAMVVKYDYNGNLTQFSIIGGEGDDTFNQVLVTDEKVIVAGKSSSTYVTASHYNCGYFKINKLGDMDTVIITMDKALIIEEGLNLSGDEADLVQEIGINQYTEQLMILSSNGVHTQKVVENTLDFDVTYINGVLKVKANEDVVSATAFDGENYYEIGEGIQLKTGAYEIKVTSADGQTLVKILNVVEQQTKNTTNYTYIYVLFAVVSLVYIVRKFKKETVTA